MSIDTENNEQDKLTVSNVKCAYAIIVNILMRYSKQKLHWLNMNWILVNSIVIFLSI